MSDTKSKIVSLRLTEEEHRFLEELADREYRKPGDTLRWLLQREKRMHQRHERLARREPADQPA